MKKILLLVILALTIQTIKASVTATGIVSCFGGNNGAALVAAIGTPTNVSCFGGNNGAATASATGGTTAYSYSWNTSPVQTTATATGLIAGTYIVTVTDAKGFTDTETVTITQPAAALVAAIGTPTNVYCFGLNTAATASATGGTTAYSYSWNTSPVQTTATASGLIAGTYTVTVTDAKGCINIETVTITEPAAALTASISSQTNVDCFGNSSGIVTIAGANGTAPYTYSKDATTFVTSGTFGSLAAGYYTITVKDANGCTNTVPVTINEPALALSATAGSQVNVSCFGGNDGSVVITPAGGTAPYTITPAQTDLTAGLKTFTVKDVKNCETTVQVTITENTVVVIANNDRGLPINGSVGGISYYNILENDTFDGELITNPNLVNITYTSTNPGITLNGTDVVVAPGTPAGNYTLVYTICSKSATCSCDSATVTVTVIAQIDAQDDTITDIDGTIGNPNAGNVLGNDTLNGSNVAIGQVNLIIITPTTSIGGAPVPSINTTTGKVSVPPGTAAGTYTIVYQICEILNPTNCDQAVVTVTIQITCPNVPQPTLACYESANFNTTTCSWDVTGIQPAQPSEVNCWDNYVFNTGTCAWDKRGTQPAQPSPTGNATQNFCSGSTVANLTAIGTNIKWYSNPTGGTPLASSTALVNGTTYYASQTVNGCESTERLAVTVSLNATATITLSSGAETLFSSICYFSDVIVYTIGNGATGVNVYSPFPSWITTTTIGTTVTISFNNSDTPPPGYWFFEISTIGGCGSATTTFTRGIDGISGVELRSPTGTDNQTTCINDPIQDVRYAVNSVLGFTNFTYIHAESFGLPAGVTLSRDYSTNEIIFSGTPTEAGVFNYFIYSNNGCNASSFYGGTIFVNSIPAPTGANNQTMTQGSTLANLVATGQNIVWYSNPFGGTPLPANTLLARGTTYYASQTINGCESQDRLPVIVQVSLSNEEFNSIKIIYNPNPVTDILNIKASTELKNAKIFDLLGQTILQQTFNSKEIQLNMSDFPAGAYFVIVESDDKKEIFKVIKK